MILIAPQLFREQLTISDAGFEVRSGIWGLTANQSVQFDGLKQIRIAVEETGGRRSRQIEVLYCDRDAAEPARLPLNNDVKIEGAKVIVLRASACGIPIVAAR